MNQYIHENRTLYRHYRTYSKIASTEYTVTMNTTYLRTRRSAKSVAVFFILISCAAAAPAEGRVDLGARAPFSFVSMNVDESYGTALPIFSEPGGLSELNFIPIPCAELSVYGDFGRFALGGGVRMYTAFIISVAYPVLWAQADFDRMTVYAGVGGGLFAAFGLLNSVSAAPAFVPELGIDFKIGRNFLLGAGLMALVDTGTMGETLPVLIYADAKFRFPF